MDGEIEVAWFVLVQLFSLVKSSFFFVLPSVHLRVLRGSLLVEKKAVQNSR